MLADRKSQIISCLDYTDLSEECSEEKVQTMCAMAMTAHGHVAALCVWPEFIQTAKTYLPPAVEIATVVNFPDGESSFDLVLSEIEVALALGATEIDAVIPYRFVLNGEMQDITDYTAHLRDFIPDDIPLKLILESGAFDDMKLLRKVCDQAIAGGADMIKTSTGKIAEGASLQAVEVFCDAIKSADKAVGIKVSGGVRTYEDAMSYINLIEEKLGSDFIAPQTFRIGASSLLDALL